MGSLHVHCTYYFLVLAAVLSKLQVIKNQRLATANVVER